MGTETCGGFWSWREIVRVSTDLDSFIYHFSHLRNRDRDGVCWTTVDEDRFKILNVFDSRDRIDDWLTRSQLSSWVIVNGKTHPNRLVVFGGNFACSHGFADARHRFAQNDVAIWYNGWSNQLVILGQNLVFRNHIRNVRWSKRRQGSSNLDILLPRLFDGILRDLSCSLNVINKIVLCNISLDFEAVWNAWIGVRGYHGGASIDIF